ncbi:MAG: polynucleotide adenylyltransferase PcnB [Pseudomonadales bacterium]|jgi:poly(A) polymerase|nr:polynucleotide adenylyltransferase PcnB [Pseudomonadales bacterium]
MGPRISSSPSASAPLPAPPHLRIISRAEHGISRQQISANCLKVLYTLNEAGYQAFIVGGGVRDLLLGLRPKDFDIATNATPDDIRALFRNSRIIGRRFRIVHVHFGREILEVSTFRALTNDQVEVVEGGLTKAERHLDSVQSSDGMILRDNVYGSIEEDVLRRDFTVNALYYTVQNFEVHDYVDGLADIDRRCLRMIGNPEQRYREDPVRVLRAIRLAAKLNFSIDPATAAPLRPYAQLLRSVPAARLFDEFIKLFFAGAGEFTFELLHHYGVFEILFPATGSALAQPEHQVRYLKLLHLAFANTDARINEDKSVTPAFLLAVILWPAVQLQVNHMVNAGAPAVPALLDAGLDILLAQLERIAIPKRFSVPMREIWELQLRLPNRRGSRAHQLLANKRFRAAYDFLRLREESGEALDGLGAWWTEFQSADPPQQQALIDALDRRTAHASTRRRRSKPPPPPSSHV